MSEPIRMDGQYQTRGGKPVMVLCVDATHTQGNVVALIDVGRGEEPYSFYADGRLLYCIDSDLDLVPVPKKHKVWVNIYPTTGNATREQADHYATPSRIACIPVEFTEGEGLSPPEEKQ